jgi:hypothetical protein
VPADDFLEDVSGQNRERKVVKCDDAAVPEYLLEEHLKTGSKIGNWNDKARQGLQVVSSCFWDQMLCWWKRKMTMSYITWMKMRYNSVRKAVNTVKVNLAGDRK